MIMITVITERKWEPWINGGGRLCTVGRNWSRIVKDGTSPLCRICHKHEETVDHIISGCPELLLLFIITRTSRQLEPNPISPGFPSSIYCNFTVGN